MQQRVTNNNPGFFLQEKQIPTGNLYPMEAIFHGPMHTCHFHEIYCNIPLVVIVKLANYL